MEMRTALKIASKFIHVLTLDGRTAATQWVKVSISQLGQPLDDSAIATVINFLEREGLQQDEAPNAHRRLHRAQKTIDAHESCLQDLQRRKHVMESGDTHEVDCYIKQTSDKLRGLLSGAMERWESTGEVSTESNQRGFDNMSMLAQHRALRPDDD